MIDEVAGNAEKMQRIVTCIDIIVETLLEVAGGGEHEAGRGRIDRARNGNGGPVDDIPPLTRRILDSCIETVSRELRVNGNLEAPIQSVCHLAHDMARGCDSQMKNALTMFANQFSIRHTVNSNHVQGRSQLDVAPHGLPVDRLPTLKEAESFLIAEALKSAGDNQRTAAEQLGISRQALNKRLLRNPELRNKASDINP